MVMQKQYHLFLLSAVDSCFVQNLDHYRYPNFHSDLLLVGPYVTVVDVLPVEETCSDITVSVNISSCCCCLGINHSGSSVCSEADDATWPSTVVTVLLSSTCCDPLVFWRGC